MFVRVRDTQTGHQFDLPEDHYLIAQELVEVLDDDRHPPKPKPRPAKHRGYDRISEAQDDGRPKGNATKDEWAAYALANGGTAEELEAMTRDEIRDAYSA